MIVRTHSPQSDRMVPVRPSTVVGPTVESVPSQVLELPDGATVESAFDEVPGPADQSLAPTGLASIDVPGPADQSLVPTRSTSIDEHRAAVLRRRDEAERLGEDIAELAARIQAATYELLVMIRAFHLD